jgi:hypothetical protein
MLGNRAGKAYRDKDYADRPTGDTISAGSAAASSPAPAATLPAPAPASPAQANPTRMISMPETIENSNPNWESGKTPPATAETAAPRLLIKYQREPRGPTTRKGASCSPQSPQRPPHQKSSSRMRSMQATILGNHHMALVQIAQFGQDINAPRPNRKNEIDKQGLYPDGQFQKPYIFNG